MNENIEYLLSKFVYSLENNKKREFKNVLNKLLKAIIDCDKEDLLLIISYFEKYQNHPFLTGAIHFKV